MKWFFLFGNIFFAVVCLSWAVVVQGVGWITAPVGLLSAFMAYVIWSDCREEWRA